MAKGNQQSLPCFFILDFFFFKFSPGKKGCLLLLEDAKIDKLGFCRKVEGFGGGPPFFLFQSKRTQTKAKIEMSFQNQNPRNFLMIRNQNDQIVGSSEVKQRETREGASMFSIPLLFFLSPVFVFRDASSFADVLHLLPFASGMEDAHATVLSLDERTGDQKISFFAVYDGHGGEFFLKL